MYKYQIPILLKENYDFSKVKSDGQKELSETLGYDFSLVDIIAYEKKISKNFTEQAPFPIEIDRTIAMIIEKHHNDTGTPNPLKKEEQTPAPVPSDVKGAVNQIQEEIDSIKFALEYLQAEADAGDADAISAIEYLQGELTALTESIK